MRNLLIPILFLTGLAGSVLAGEAPFEVHEWGVWVRDDVRVTPFSGKGSSGSPGEPRTLLVSPTELADHLPSFVGVHRSSYMPKNMYRNWKKPVIHIYGREGLAVNVEVLTPQGEPTAYWPKPKFVENTRWFMGSGKSEAVGMVWSGRLHAAAPADLPVAAGKHWWNTVREVPSAYLKTENGSERFVFYEATALQEPTVTAQIAKDAIVLRNAHDRPSARVLLILNDGKELRWQSIKEIPAKGEATITREALFMAREPGASLFDDCETQWLGFGLTKAEAHAIVETWKEDLATRYGFLLISRMPEPLYDQMFPLTVTPKPDKIVRAGVVFDTLAGQSMRAEWLPHLQDDLKAWAKDLRNEEFEVRAKAQSKLAQVDTLAKPLLEQLATEKDPETAAAAKPLLKRFEPAIINSPLGAPAEPGSLKR